MKWSRRENLCYKEEEYVPIFLFYFYKDMSKDQSFKNKINL